MNRDTILFLVICMGVGMALAGVGLALLDAMVLAPPNADTTVQVVGSIQ